MSEMTLYVGGPTSEPIKIELNWFDGNGVHCVLPITATNDDGRLVLKVDDKVVCMSSSNGIKVFA